MEGGKGVERCAVRLSKQKIVIQFLYFDFNYLNNMVVVGVVGEKEDFHRDGQSHSFTLWLKSKYVQEVVWKYITVLCENDIFL